MRNFVLRSVQFLHTDGESSTVKDSFTWHWIPSKLERMGMSEISKERIARGMCITFCLPQTLETGYPLITSVHILQLVIAYMTCVTNGPSNHQVPSWSSCVCKLVYCAFMLRSVLIVKFS